MKCNGKASKAKVRNCRKTCGKRVSRNARAINGARLMGTKRIAASSDCHGNSSQPGATEERALCPKYAINPVQDCSPEFESKVHLEGETTIESLPPDILVKIICNFRHDELNPLSCVSRKFRDAVVTARQMHFDFSTPVRLRDPKRRANSLMPNATSENSASTVEGLKYLYTSARRLATPNAPKQVGKFQKPGLFSEDTIEIPKVLFLSGKDDDAIYPSQNYSLRSSCSITGRVLFIEDELCEAIFRNRL
ncbi:hypothetical protein SUGI_0720610 [Cryptomeria japonica]|nr:hypothetical protein SUGI_0720610 [Cryptomeria japonica]